MKKTIAIILFSIQFIFAQQNMMTISAEKKTASKVDWETTITINVADEIRAGFQLTLPKALRLIPLSVRINQKNLWLQNARVVSDVDSVVSWNLLDDGIVFQFNSDQLRSGDQLTINSMTTVVRSDLNPESAIGIFSLGNEQALQSVALPANLLGGQ
jgi:hypothetical protein